MRTVIDRHKRKDIDVIDARSNRRLDNSTIALHRSDHRLNRRGFTLATLTTLALATTSGVASLRSGAAQTASPVSGPGATELYRIDLAAGQVPAGELVVGAVLQELATGTSVSYPAGSAPESLAIDYLVSGGYVASSPSDLAVINGDRTFSDVAPGEPIEVVAGDALLVVDNEDELTTIAGDEATVSLTLGFFTLAEGSGVVEIEGELVSTFLGAPPPLELPAEGVTVVLLDGSAEATDWPDALVVLPVTSERLPDDWSFLILPLVASSSTPAVASPVD